MKTGKSMTLLLAVAIFTILPSWSAQAADSARADGPPRGKIIRAVASLGPDGIQRLEVSGGEYYFDPNQLVVKVNTPVELKIRKVGSFVPHNAIVKAPEAGIDFTINLKKDFQTVRFTPTKTGQFPIYCDKQLLWFSDHREKGMDGVIEVVE
ncbi:MAG TPA: hypothetical protein VLA15_06310, partial [Desulfurivibrionaceae bacterium]|nr:hypothetical protein [Desulfurivibrionaceae bacterium]